MRFKKLIAVIRRYVLPALGILAIMLLLGWMQRDDEKSMAEQKAIDDQVYSTPATN